MGKYYDMDTSEAEMQFIDDYPFASQLLEYVKTISNGNHWFICDCVRHDKSSYWATFKSYRSPEFRDFVLVIHVSNTSTKWDFSISQQVTTELS